MTNKNVVDLNGKVALVSGAAKGLGLVISQTLAAAGARVMMTDILETEGRAAAAGIAGARFRVHDVVSEAQWEQAVAACFDELGGLDIVVNNAGIEHMKLVTDFKVDEFRRVMDVNVTGVFLGMKHAIAKMAPAGRGGSIVNISSIAGLIGVPALSAYCASKGAVRTMTKAVAVECGKLKTGIRVNSVHPGVVDNDMGNAFLDHFVELGIMPDRATSEATFIDAHPLGEFGRQSDVANAVLYLASDQSRWSTGIELVVDGGFTAQ